MAWTDLAANEVPNFSEVEAAATAGHLIWSGGVGPSPGTYVPEWVFTRQDFENEIEHSSMAASGIALNELMRKSEYDTYAIVTPHIAPTIVSILAQSNYQIRCEIQSPGLYPYYTSWELWRSDESELIMTYAAGPINHTVHTFQSDSSRQDQIVKFRARFFTTGPNYGNYSSWSGNAAISGGLG